MFVMNPEYRMRGHSPWSTTLAPAGEVARHNNYPKRAVQSATGRTL